jgi:hypothetical protein
MSVFKERLEKIKLNNLKVPHKKNHSWPIEKKIEVVSQFLILGNMKLVSAVTGVSHELIRQWKAQPWWKELEAEIRQTQNIEMDTKLSKIVEKSLDATLDRIENGEFFYDQKTGQVKRKPASLRDVARVSVDMLSKRELLRGGAENRQENTQVAIAEQLKVLAAEFAKWNGKKKTDVIELVEVEDAIYEERQEGLQTGTSVGTQEETGEGEGEGFEELSPEDDDGRGEGS